MKKLFIALILSVWALGLQAYRPEAVDSLQRELANATTLEDSLRLGYDLFDASARSQQVARGEMILDIATRMGDVGVQLDMLRNLANMVTARQTDSIFDVYLAHARRLPSSDERDLTILFIKIKQNTRAARSTSIEESRKKVVELMERSEVSKNRSISTQLEILFTLCAYTEQLTTDDLLTNQLEQIGELIDELPMQLDALESLYLSQSALTYTANYNPTKAVQADKALLEHIEKLKHKYNAMGRHFRDFDYSSYIIYRRLLANYAALTPEEVETYYQAACDAANHDPLAKNDFDVHRRPDIYRYMAREEYDKAYPLLLAEMQGPVKKYDIYVQRMLLDCMIEASQATGHEDTLMRALLALRKIDGSEQHRHNAEQFHKLQLVYDRNSEQLLETQLKLEKQTAVARSHRLLTVAVLLFSFLLLALVVVLVVMWRRVKRLNLSLEKTNVRLTDERDTLQRTQADLIRTGERMRAAEKQKEEFIDNMSHEVSTPLNAIVEYSQLIVDCVDADKQAYLSRFARVIKLNTELVLTLVNDVLDLSSVDSGTLKIERKPVAVGQLAQVAVDSVRIRMRPGVELVNNISPDDRLLLNTDENRVTQVLLNLLINAAKFTPEGSVTLDGGLGADGRMYRFTITDTGIGIPAGKEEVIFERFEKLNRHSQGIGLGLSVSRMVASLLGGDVRVDTTYEGSGSRFIFTVPVK